MPLNRPRFTQLGLLQTGVMPLTLGLLEAGGSSREGQAYAVNGQCPESNNFLIDGANNFHTLDGGVVMEPPIDAIAEFRILTHTASAEFGHSTGSTTNITRSGTDNFHGSLWDFVRNNAMDAKSFFADSVEPLERNQFGGTFGGPLKKDKTFFFLYYEGLRDQPGETTRTTVPSNAERTGDFADQCTLNSGTFNSQGASQSVAGENDLAQNPFNLKSEWGRSMFDARHRFVLSYQWNLPWFSHAHNYYGHILGNWQVNGITTLMSNTPFTVYDSSNPSFQGPAPEISGFFSSRPNIVGDPNSGTCSGGAGVHTPQCWFNIGAFQHAPPGQFGDVGRNTLDGPAFQQWDFSAIKTIHVHETMNLQFRAEFFNIFQLPDNDISLPNFGQIQTAQPGPVTQLALKFAF